MKVLITGGNGQLAHALSNSAPIEWQVHSLRRDELDIANAQGMRAAIMKIEPSVVINAAAYTAVDQAETDSQAAFRVNAEGVAMLANICAELNIRLVHFSTDFVFAGAKSRPYRPKDKPAPVNVYGRSKLVGEAAALLHPGNLVIRTAWLYGNHGNNFVRTMLRLMRERETLAVVSDQLGTPTYAQSLAVAAWSLIKRDANGLHHFTDAGIASWYDFAIAVQEEAIVCNLIDRKIPIIPISSRQYPTATRRPSYSVLDKSETWAFLGSAARHWRVELRDMLAVEQRLHG